MLHKPKRDYRVGLAVGAAVAVDLPGEYVGCNSIEMSTEASAVVV
jgi:hypothetical protein